MANGGGGHDMIYRESKASPSHTCVINIMVYIYIDICLENTWSGAKYAGA